jgi:serine/threonine protein kinase
MDAHKSRIIVKNKAMPPRTGPVPLPDGNQQMSLGSGVITKLLGRGGMAAVYEIWNQQLEIYRAVKLINPGSAETVHQRFQTEIKISAKLNHPNIIEIHGVGEWNGLPFIEMERIDGIGLDKLITQRGALPPTVCTSIGIMICRALNYAHNQDCSIYGKNYHGVIHRDLKPANIMVCASGIVKLMDFGIARPADVSFHTMDGMVTGTLQYLAPEQLEKKKLDATTDLYALGVTMYEIVTGTVAFPQTSILKLIANKTKNKFKPLEEFNIKLPPRLMRAIYKCMVESQEKRVRSATVLLEELHTIHASLTDMSPEQIMETVVGADKENKIVLATHRRFPFKLIATLTIVAALLAGGYRYLAPEIQLALSHEAETVFSTPLPVAHPPTPAAETPAKAKPRETATQKKRPSPAKPKILVSEEKTVTKPPPAPAKTLSLFESLQEKHGVKDILVIMEKELKAKNYVNVLGLCDMLPAELSQTPQALIYKMRALEKIGNLGRLEQFLESATLNDGEFFLEKAKFAFKNQQYENCKRLLLQSMNFPHAYMDYDILKLEVSYYTALCATAQFDASPTEKNYKEALDSWWQLRNGLRLDPNHEYNKKAVVELQRMAIKMKKG